MTDIGRYLIKKKSIYFTLLDSEWRDELASACLSSIFRAVNILQFSALRIVSSWRSDLIGTLGKTSFT